MTEDKRTRPRICVVGSANVDLTFRAPRLPVPGETLAAHSLHQGMGGKGANQAVAAARLGAQVALIARVGGDAYGKEAVLAYESEGIDASFIKRAEDQPTGTAAILVDDAARRAVVVSGISVTRTGTQTSFPTLEELDKRIQREELT